MVSKKSFKEAEFSTKWRSSHLAAGCNVTFLDFLDDDSLPLPATESIDSLPQRGASPAMLDFGIF